MKQFGTIFSFEWRSYFKNKIFVGVTILFVAIIAVVMFIPRITASDAPAEEGERSLMMVKAPAENQSDFAAELFSRAFPEYRVEAFREDTESLKKLISGGGVHCAVVLDSFSSYTFYVENLSLYDSDAERVAEVMQTLAQSYAMEENGLTPDQALAVLSAEARGEVVNLGVDQMQNYFYTYIMIFALYMVIILYGQMVATGVATEKSSRAMELLITSAKPVSMMFGKVLAAALAGFLQLAAIFGSAILFYQINRDWWADNPIITSIFAMPAKLFVFLLVYFVLGFLIYAFLYGAVGSTASKLEDVNTSVMPITLTFIAAFFVVMFSMSSGNVDTPLMRVASFIPFTSPMAMFTRIAMSEVAPWEIGLSIVILVLSAGFIGWIAAKIYRVGVLMYGKPPKIGSLLKAAWRA